MAKNTKPLVLDLSEVGAGDVQLVGGKCASLGELFRALIPRGVRSVDGFATTSEGYRLLLETNGLGKRLRELMRGLDHNDIRALNDAGREARALMLDTKLPEKVHEAIIGAYRQLCSRLGRTPEVAVRSSATAEDLPDASFAGQQDTILNVRGEDHLRAASLLRIPLDRPSHFLSRRARLRPLRSFALNRNSANGAFRSGVLRCDVFAGH